jgi:predicted DNA-binding ribbon-helix-helix protein
MNVSRSSTPVEEMSALKFRVVTVQGQRRGIKLEEIFWSSLSELATLRGLKLADIVAECERGIGEGGNLTARLRYVAARYLRDQLSDARERSSLPVVAGQVHACPSPAFALAGNKRIIAYNPAFLAFVQSRFLGFQSSPPAQGLRLSFDVQFAELVKRLKSSPGEPQPAGFTIGINQHVTRGRLNAALASLLDQDVVLGFILS